MATYNPALPGRHVFNEKGVHLQNVEQFEIDDKLFVAGSDVVGSGSSTVIPSTKAVKDYADGLLTKTMPPSFNRVFESLVWRNTQTFLITPYLVNSICWLQIRGGWEKCDVALGAQDYVHTAVGQELPVQYRPAFEVRTYGGQGVSPRNVDAVVGPLEIVIETNGVITFRFLIERNGLFEAALNDDTYVNDGVQVMVGPYMVA